MNRLIHEFKYQLRYGFPVWLISTLLAWLPDVGPSIRLRGLLISLFLPGTPKGFKIGRDVTLLSINRLMLGNNIYIAKGCWLNAVGGITMEDEVVLAPYVVMSSSNHGFLDGSVQRGGAHPAPIHIGFGTWIAAHSVVTAGVSIGRSNLVAANTVVTKNSPENSVLAGVPAKVVKERTDNPSDVTSKYEMMTHEKK